MNVGNLALRTVAPAVCAVILALGAASQAAAVSSVNEAKAVRDLETVTLDAMTVTASFPGFFYVQDQVGAGIRVNGKQPVTAGAVVNILGTMSSEANGERSVSAISVTATGSADAKPALEFVSEAGRLVTLRGQVVRGGVVSDGQREVRLLLPEGVASPDPGAAIAVTGISATINLGQERSPAVRVASAEGLRVLASSPMEIKYADPMIYIPAGTFLMGAVGSDWQAHPSEKPQHEVYLDGYWVGKYEVTRREYRKFVDAGGYDDPQYWSAEGWHYRNLYGWTHPAWWDAQAQFGGHVFTQTEDHPVVGVSWYEAEAYCNWAGVRLLTEAEWEKAAHWNPSANRSTIYPWDDRWDYQKCNWWYDSLYRDRQTAPVGSYPAGASHYGCMDMAGNVWEWVSDWMDPTYYQQTPSGGWVNPTGPRSNPFRTKVIKGGGWWGDYPGVYGISGCRSSNRGEMFARWNEYYNENGGKIGFRVAR